jgi:hypothetical protein
MRGIVDDPLKLLAAEHVLVKLGDKSLVSQSLRTFRHPVKTSAGKQFKLTSHVRLEPDGPCW